MKRRASLALALFLTTIVGFFIVAYGTQVGFFGSDDRSDDAPADAAGAVTPTSVPTTAPPQPQVIEQIIYRDEYVSAPATDSAGNTSSGGTTANPDSQPSGSSGGGGGDESSQGELREEGLNGWVQTVGASSFTLGGTHVGDALISVSSQTEFSSALAPSFSFSQITPGMYLKTKVLVAGGDLPTGPNGSWAAVSVKQDVKTIGLDGTVTSVGSGTFTLSGTREGTAVIVVDGSTKYASDIDGSFSFADIHTGMYLKTKVVVGEGDEPTGPSGSWIAFSVTEAVPG